MMQTRRPRSGWCGAQRIAFGVLLLGAINCSEHRQADLNAAERAVGTPRKASVSELFKLVEEDDRLLPVDLEADEHGCALTLRGGALELDGVRWILTDSVSMRCTATTAIADSAIVRLESGQIARSGDTIVLQQFDTLRKKSYIINQGLLSGDSLRTGGLLFDGPPRLYLRK